MRILLTALFFCFNVSTHAAHTNSPSYTPVHSYAYDYTCIMDNGDGNWRQDDGIVINFPKDERPLDVAVVDDGDLQVSLDCSMQNNNDMLDFNCTYSRVGFEISIQPDLSGTMKVVKSPKRTSVYSLSCLDNRS